MTASRRLKNHLLYGLGRALLAALSGCPLSWLRPVGRALGRAGYRLASHERRRALTNLAAADLGLAEGERRRLCREVFARLGHVVVEALALPRLVRRGPLARFDARAVALLARAGGAVVTTAHLGNFELLAAAIAQRRGEPVYVLARRSYEPRFTALLERRRRQVAVVPLWVEDRSCALRALRALRAGAWVGVLIDRAPRAGGEALPFFGRGAPTDLLAAGLARVAAVPLHVGWVERREGARAGDGAGQQVSLVPTDANDDRARIAEATARLESAIRARPADWLWTLDRWRDRP
ncbi:MAG: hypothetical protein CSB49_05245 [Proteobacteria bacterium]|nr:MAG: hypothetical protein CSB49_05245 [Pseudomonadota bacterium]